MQTARLEAAPQIESNTAQGQGSPREALVDLSRPADAAPFEGKL